jgi:mannosyltransferase
MTAPAEPAARPADPFDAPAPGDGGGRWHAFPDRPGGIALVGAVAVVVVGIAFRLYSRSELWLDEALTVNIARLSPGDMFEALRHDGHPPLYYLLLHGWMAVFGESNNAVRSLSGLLGIATLPVIYVVGRRLGGARAGLAALLVFAASPFAIRYATETRMYSLVMLLVLCGWLAIQTSLTRASRWSFLAVAACSGALALSHYWSFYLLIATAGLLLVAWRRGVPNAGRTFLALAAGAVLFLPWLPSFLEQAGSTGTPWGRPERPTVVLMTSLTDWGGGPYAEAQLLGIVVLTLAVLAIVVRTIDRYRLEIDVRTRPGVRAEAVVVLLTILVAVAAGYATNSAFASRYTAVIFPLVIVIAGYGLSRLPGAVWIGGLVAVLAFSSIGAVRNVTTQRTEAGVVAKTIVREGAPGDVVAYCPDQLGPAVSRLVPSTFVQQTFPAKGDPHFVDWTDYAAKQAAGDPVAFAKELDQRAGAGSVWLVWSIGYRTLGTKCEQLANALGSLRPGREVVASGSEFEHAALHQYGPGHG